MPKITFVNKNKTVDVENGATILDAAVEHGVDLEHACGGFGACSTCHVHIREGMKNISEITEEEEDKLDDAKGVTLDSRLACLCKVHGDVVVEIP